MKNNAVILREIDATFATELTRLWIRTFSEAYSEEHTAENIQLYCETHFTEPLAAAALADPRTRCTLAFRDSNPIGFTLIRHHDAPYPLPGTASELKQIYVISNEFGTGTGDALLRDAMSAISAAGRNWTWLLVSNKNLRAIAFYKKHQFRCLGPGETIAVGSDTLPSSILARKV